MKSVIKWAGGKSSIIDEIIGSFPDTIENFYDVFVGGGSVLLAILESKKINIKGTVYAYDINEGLIGMFKNIQSNSAGLLLELKKLKSEYYTNPENFEKFYYEKRTEFNSLKDKISLKYSALFIFLNKTGFRGLYRESKNGFNVPFGNYKMPEIYNEKSILEMSRVIKDVVFECISFDESVLKAKKNDFMYLDPPYFPVSLTSFVKYNSKSFSKEDHLNLFDLLKKTTASFVLSNSDTDIVKEFFQGYSIKTIPVKRRINSKNPQAIANEVIIKK